MQIHLSVVHRPGMPPRSRSRNRQCMPSDDEGDDDEEPEDEQDSDDERPRGQRSNKTSNLTKPIRKSRPLPSDDEEEDEEDNESEGKPRGIIKK